MKLDANQIKELRTLFELGISVESLSVVAAFCLKHDRHETLKKLHQLVKEFNSSLTSNEKQELENDMKVLIEARMADVARELKTSLTDEEISDFVEELKSVTPTPTTLF